MPTQQMFLKSYGGVAAFYSVAFDGSDWLDIADDSDFTFGTNDFTIECFYKTNNLSGLSNSFDYIFSAGWPIQLAHTNGSSQKITFYMKDTAAGGSGTYVINDLNTGTGSITSTSVWYHIAVTRDSNTFRIFLNGVLKGIATSSVSAPAPGEASSIGRFSPAAPYYYANGTISNLRYIKGTALYTTNFTAPSTALTNVTNTKLLCCNQSTTTGSTITPNTISAGGDPTAVTTNPFPFSPTLGGTDNAVDFDGATDGDALTVADFPNFLTNNFTVECWIYPHVASGAGINTIMDIYQNSSASGAWWALHQNDDGFYWGRNGTNPISTSGNLSNNTWYHVAFVRNGTSNNLYLAGNSIGDFTETAYNYSDGGSETRTLSVGRQHNPGSGRQFDGLISNARITIGQALYTSNFTPTTSPLTLTSQSATASNVKLLCCCEPTPTGAPKTSGTITAIGTPTTSDGPF